MKPSLHKRNLWFLMVAFVLVVWCGYCTSQSTNHTKETTTPTAKSSHKVLACYFHRTVRCPTCQKIGAYVEEGVKSGFAQEMKDGRVGLVMIDFQDPKNQGHTNTFNISGPTLVIMNVKDGLVTQWKRAPRVWSLVGNPEAFYKYVQDEVRGYLDAK